MGLYRPTPSPPVFETLPTVTGDLHGLWQTTFTVPATTTPGRYLLYADCTYSRSTTAQYAPATVTVTAPPRPGS